MFTHAPNILALLCLLYMLDFTRAQVVSTGPCPANIKTVKDLDTERFFGRWYEYAKYPFVFEFNAKCIFAEYGKRSDDKVSVYNQQTDILTGLNKNIQGTASSEGPGKFLVRFDNQPAIISGSNYWVLGTDYDNYLVTYSCQDFVYFHTTVVWILTRKPKPKVIYTSRAKNIISANGISLYELTQTDHMNCNY